ncbi:hypothetical protein [Enterococcus hailinensis]|uniref:hypothetical protein n=1 Tax=Enterococcus hailinensis TaxID=3238988 RepID=UPI0038B4179E
MDIRQNQAAELMPFLEAVFQQQDNLHFANEVPQANEKTIALGAWDQGKLILARSLANANTTLCIFHC